MLRGFFAGRDHDNQNMEVMVRVLKEALDAEILLE